MQMNFKKKKKQLKAWEVQQFNVSFRMWRYTTTGSSLVVEKITVEHFNAHVKEASGSEPSVYLSDIHIHMNQNNFPC